VQHWVAMFYSRLDYVKEKQVELYEKIVGNKLLLKIFEAYRSSKKTLFLLDYDGTLISFLNNPEEGRPDQEIIGIISKLAEKEKNDVVVSTGRDKDVFSRWFNNQTVGLMAEHGLWNKQDGEDWQITENLNDDWKRKIEPLLESYVERTPGAYIEKKNQCFAWHYRFADPGLGEIRAREMMSTLKILIHNLNLNIVEGNQVIEVKSSAVSKKRGFEKWVSKEHYDAVFVIGFLANSQEDYSNLNENTITVNVGDACEEAMYSIPSWKEVRILLKLLGSE